MLKEFSFDEIDDFCREYLEIIRFFILDEFKEMLVKII